jgi:DNA-binding response OmpR family regulator
MSQHTIEAEFPSSLNVLVVEDEPDVAKTICLFIERSGMRAFWAKDGAEAVEAKRNFAPDVVLVDMHLPDTNGVSLIPWLARGGDCGIIVVSGSSEEAERIVGIELGADDYVTKPPSLRELVARIRAVHRRVMPRAAQAAGDPTRVDASAAQPASSSGGLDDIVAVGAVRIDMRRREVVDDAGTRTPLTSAEIRALKVLLERNGEPVSRDQLCEAALHRKLGFEDRSVDQLILNIRRKLSRSDESGRRLISSVRGAGYALQY